MALQILKTARRVMEEGHRSGIQPNLKVPVQMLYMGNAWDDTDLP